MQTLSPRFALTHGSRDSTDVDRIYFFDELPPLADCHAFCAEGTPAENRNIAVLRDGVVAACFKGLPDEVNNGLLRTASLHPQNGPNPIERRVARITALKTTRAVRLILTRLTRTPQRTSIKRALRSYHVETRNEVLATIPFHTLDLSVDAYKSIAFQLGQSLALLDGEELYTKQEIAQTFPALRPALYRCATQTDLLALNQHRDQLLAALSPLSTTPQTILSLFSNNRTTDPRLRTYQGLVLDVKNERCTAWPPAHDALNQTLSSLWSHQNTWRVTSTRAWLSPEEQTAQKHQWAQHQPRPEARYSYFAVLGASGLLKVLGARDLWTGDFLESTEKTNAEKSIG